MSKYFEYKKAIYLFTLDNFEKQLRVEMSKRTREIEICLGKIVVLSDAVLTEERKALEFLNCHPKNFTRNGENVG